MQVQLQIAIVLVIVVALLIKKFGLKGWHAVAVVLFGFLLHDTSLAPAIERTVNAITQAIGTWRL
ncbi:hypothetical protein ACFYWU_41115 [Streptomyces chrestomyceticus]|uniref:hypothetical protein n=1 Tax=Streptomyces chrestomyceticus TaxID=68185 RepID=UPI0036CBFD9C